VEQQNPQTKSTFGDSGTGEGVGSISFEIVDSVIPCGITSTLILRAPNGSSIDFNIRGSIG